MPHALCCLTALVVFRMCCVQERSDKIVTLRYLKEPTICIGWLPKSRITGMGLGEGMIGRTLVFDEFSVRPWFLVGVLSRVGGSIENNACRQHTRQVWNQAKEAWMK